MNRFLHRRISGRPKRAVSGNKLEILIVLEYLKKELIKRNIEVTIKKLVVIDCHAKDQTKEIEVIKMLRIL